MGIFLKTKPDDNAQVLLDTTAPSPENLFNVAIATLKFKVQDLGIYLGHFDQAEISSKQIAVDSNLTIQEFIESNKDIINSWITGSYGSSNPLPNVVKYHVPTWYNDYFKINIEHMFDFWGFEEGVIKIIEWLRTVVKDAVKLERNRVVDTNDLRQFSNENCFDGIIIADHYYPSKELNDEYVEYAKILAYNAEKYDGWFFKAINGTFKISDADFKYLSEIASDKSWVLTPTLAKGLAWAKNHTRDDEDDDIVGITFAGEDPE